MALVETSIFPGAIASDANMHNFKNVVPSSGTTPATLSAAIAATDTTIALASGTGAKLPTTNFSVSIDDEIIFVTSRATDTLTVGTRGYEGSTAAAHVIGASVFGNITAKSHNQIVSEINAIQTQLGANLVNVQKTSAKGTANGYASLDSTTKVPSAQIPYKAVRAMSATGNLLVTDQLVFVTTGASNIVPSLPTAVGNAGLQITVKKVDSGAGSAVVTPLAASGQTIDGDTPYTLTIQTQYAQFTSDGANWQITASN